MEVQEAEFGLIARKGDGEMCEPVEAVRRLDWPGLLEYDVPESPTNLGELRGRSLVYVSPRTRFFVYCVFW